MPSLSTIGDIALSVSEGMATSVERRQAGGWIKGRKLWISCAYLNPAEVLTVDRRQKGGFRRGEDVIDASLLLRYIHIHMQKFSMCKCVVDIHL